MTRPLLPPLTVRALVLLSPDPSATGRRIEIEDGREVVVGRSAECDLAIDDGELSRRHLVIRRDPFGDLTIEDLGSRNGSRVGRRRVEGPRTLERDSVIRAGRTVLLAGPAPRDLGDGDDDAWIGWLARTIASRWGGVYAIAGATGPALARALATRPDERGSVILGAPTPGGSAHAAAFSTRVSEGEGVREAQSLVASVRACGGRAVFLAPAITEALERVVGSDHVVTIPPLGERPGELFRRTRAALRAAGVKARFRPVALTQWLLADHDASSFPGRLLRLVSAAAGADEIDSVTVRRALGQAPAGPPPSAGYDMRRPAEEALATQLLAAGSISALARELGRTRRQVQRWVQAAGLANPRVSGSQGSVDS